MSDAPPKAGPGASRAAWAEYAAQAGVEVGDDASRDEIIAAVEADSDEPDVVAAPKPEPVDVVFESSSPSKRVYSDRGGVAARFKDGRFVTSDPAVVAILDDLSDVWRLEE